MDGDEKNKPSNPSDSAPDSEARYKRLTSERTKKASDELFSASEEDLNESFKSEQ